MALAVVSSYYNLNHSKYRLANYRVFRAALDAGIIFEQDDWPEQIEKSLQRSHAPELHQEVEAYLTSFGE